MVNTEGDQILLVTGLLLIFGTFVEKRLGSWRMLAIFWGATTDGALLGGLLLHVLYPLFPDVEVFDTGWSRVFNRGSAGGFGLMAAFAATSRRWWIWVGLFAIWEPTFWATVSQDYTSVFHIIAFVTGFLMAAARVCDQKRARLTRRTGECLADRASGARFQLRPGLVWSEQTPPSSSPL